MDLDAKDSLKKSKFQDVSSAEGGTSTGPALGSAGTATATTVTSVPVPSSLPSSSSSSLSTSSSLSNSSIVASQAVVLKPPVGLNRIDEETDWEEDGCDTEDEESDDEELLIHRKSVQQVASAIILSS